jgi:hypothetical protein
MLAEAACLVDDRHRLAEVASVLGNVRHNKRLNRFTLRGDDKVIAQWRLFCLAHNIDEMASLSDRP